MTPVLRIHLIAGFPYPAKREFLQELETRAAIPEPNRTRPTREQDRIALDLPGHVEPAPLIEAWADPEAATAWAGRPARLESTTVVLDAEHLARDLGSKDLLAERGWAARARDTRSVADLLFEQLEAADRIAIGGGDATPPPAWIRVLNPYAEISEPRSTIAEIAKEGGGRSVWPRASWRRLRDGLSLPPGSPPALVYRRRRPFDQVRFQHWLIRGATDVVRAKGIVWLANNPDLVLGYSRAGSVQRLFVAGRWPRAGAEPAWDPNHPDQAELLARWDPRAGLRHQELVLIGSALDPARTEEALDRCLATDAELERAGRSHPLQAIPTGGRPATH